MHMLYMEGGGIPQVIIDGVLAEVVTQTNASNWVDAQLGLAGDYMAQVAHHIANADLPSWFPGKGANNNPYTCLTLIEIPTFVSGDFHNVFQKDNEAGNPYFLWLRDTGQINFTLTTGSYQSAGGIAAKQPALVGSLFDGTNASVIIDGIIEGSVSSTITANTSPLNIGTRSDSVGDTNRILNGYMNFSSFFNRPIDQAALSDLAADPFGPIREIARSSRRAAAATIVRPFITQRTKNYPALRFH
jgi:hypothetical protein